MSHLFASHRSVVRTLNGIVATSQVLAAEAGRDILKAGGNAADAAVATAAVLNVVEPMSTGIGGDAFALTYEAKTGKVTALNASGRSPYAATIDAVRQRGHSRMPVRGFLPVTVPGTVAGWADLLARHGSMSLAQVLEPAIEYAERGFPVTDIIAGYWRNAVPKLQADPAAAAAYLPQGRAPRPGEIIRQPDLARSLRLIADEGPAAFYHGEIARRIVEHSHANGGLLEMADFADHTSTWTDPISIERRGVRLYECPPNGQGLVALQALNMLQDDDLGALGYGSPAFWHLLIESIKLAFEDGRTYIADPELAPAPLDRLLSREYAMQQRRRIDAQRAGAGCDPDAGSDTVYLCAVDKERNAVSFINSLYMGFGSGVVAPGTGVALQNRGALFSLNPERANRLAPHKRPYHTIIPGLATKNGRLLMPFGVMGGFMQPQGHLQVLVNMLDFGMDPQTALDAPRFRYEAGRHVEVEPGIEADVQAALRAMGHEVGESAGAGYGGGQIIVLDEENGALLAGSDPRKDGCAAAY